MSVAVSLVGPLPTPLRRSWRYRLGKGSGNDPANLQAITLVHENRIEALGFNHAIRERVDRWRRVGDHPLPSRPRQTVAKLHAQLI
jgi:hypothetical protein